MRKPEQEDSSAQPNGSAAPERQDLRDDTTTSGAPPSVTSDTILFEEDARLRALALKQVFENTREHEHCHDLVCNGNRRYPRGVREHGCSCHGREMRLYAELLRLREFRDRVTVIAKGFSEDGNTIRKHARDFNGLKACCAAELRNAAGMLNMALAGSERTHAPDSAEILSHERSTSDRPRDKSSSSPEIN